MNLTLLMPGDLKITKLQAVSRNDGRGSLCDACFSCFATWTLSSLSQKNGQKKKANAFFERGLAAATSKLNFPN